VYKYIYAKGEMADRTRTFNWAGTQLGIIPTWPAPLLMMVNQILDSSFPMFIWWGQEKIQFYNDAYLNILGTDENSKHPKALGQRGAECWQEIWPIINPLLESVLSTGTSVYLEDQLIPIYRYGILDEVYWTFSYNIIRDTDGSAGGILVVCSETTEKVQFRLEIAQINEELSASNEEMFAANEELNQSQQDLRSLNNELEDRVLKRTGQLQESQLNIHLQKQRLETIIAEIPAGLAILQGEQMVLEMANDHMLSLWNKDYTSIGKPLLAFLPELNEQAFPDLLRQVYLTGIPYATQDAPVKLNKDGEEELLYMDFSYTPLKDPAQNTHSILVLAVNVTERTQSAQREQVLSEELSATNEELSAANEELTDTVGKLDLVLGQLKGNLRQLAISEGRFQNLVRDASVGIIVLTGENMDVMIVNNAYAKLIGRSVKELHHQRLFNIIPEAESYFRKIIDQVKLSGEPIFLYDTPYFVFTQGEKIEGYLNLVYQPFTDTDGKIIGTMVICHDVTDYVDARRKLEQAEEMSRLSSEAANLGNYLLDSQTQVLVLSLKTKELLGYDPDQDIPYETLIRQITSDHRQKVLEAIEATLTNKEPYNIEYTILKNNDRTLRWIKALGGMYPDARGNVTQFYGVLMDITEQKQDEQRKNDFIAMVSHELKTPLTSLNGYLQILQSKAKKATDAFNLVALDKSAKQVKRMTTLINGFLDVSRLESGNIYIDKQIFDMAELMGEIKLEITDTVFSHNIVFAPVKRTIVFADRDKIGQVINNYISNAIKYSPSKSTINVACVTVSGLVHVSVKDQGFGIAPEDLDKLFERFYRVKNTHTTPGFGIGLYLCEEIIQRHQGKNWVESQVGKGSTFHFTLPEVDS
jgi:two-component system sensor histidine kinase VicK